MDEIGDDLVVMQKGSSDIFGGFIPEETVDRIAALPGIVRVSGELVTFAPSGSANNVLTLGWPDASYLWKKVPLREGRVPAAAERRVAVLGDTAAASLGKKLDGDRVEQRAHHDVDRDRGNIDVRERLRPRRAVELACRIRVSAHSGNRQPDLVQAERRPDRAGRRCSLRALRSRGAVAGVAGGSDGTCGGAAAPVSARQGRGRAGGSES